MDSVLLFSLLLIAVAIGWALGVRSGKSRASLRKPDWFPSQEELLGNHSEGFVQKLLESSRDAETLDLALRIGRSLREKGETHRAIQFHQNLLARTDLSQSVLNDVELELALDYFHAGLNDRSENILIKLSVLSAEAVGKQALETLVLLYEEEGEWQKIVDFHDGRRPAFEGNLRRSVSHAACELAIEALDSGNYLDARKFCRKALKIDGRCARAQAVQGDMAFRHQEPREAIRCYLKAIELDPNCLAALLDRLIVAFRAVGDDRGLYIHLKDVAPEINYIPALVSMVEVQAPHAGFDAAVDAYLERLSSKPSHYGFVACMGLLARNNRQLSESQLRTAYDILRRLDAREPRFFCSHCGFEGRQFRWRCPSCNNWSTFKPFTSRTSSLSNFKDL